MIDRVFAVGGLLGQRQHLHFLAGAGGGLETAGAAVDALLPHLIGCRALRIIGQPYHPRHLGGVGYRTGIGRCVFRAVDVVGQPVNADP